jgi:hypothetical protein
VITPFYPSQPTVPGFEDQADTMSYLETIGKMQSKPLIGLEYCVELLDMNAKEPFYVCTLCEKRCDPRNIIPQITSHRHRMKYLVRVDKVLLQFIEILTYYSSKKSIERYCLFGRIPQLQFSQQGIL